MLRTAAGKLLQVLALYWLAFGLVGLWRMYWLVTLPVAIDGKPSVHSLANYLLWFFMYPSSNLSAMLTGAWIDDAGYRPDLVMTVSFAFLAGIGLYLRRPLPVGLALAAPVAYHVVQSIALRMGSIF